MKHNNFLLATTTTALVIISFFAGFITQREVTSDHKKQRDTLIFKTHDTDSMKLYVILKDGKLQSFWYKKIWKHQPTSK